MTGPTRTLLPHFTSLDAQDHWLDELTDEALERRRGVAAAPIPNPGKADPYYWARQVVGTGSWPNETYLRLRAGILMDYRGLLKRWPEKPGGRR